MLATRFFVVAILLFSGSTLLAQEAEVKASSATDTKVKIHKGKRVRATSPQDEYRARFKDKSKKAVNVKEAKPKVYKTTKRKQKKNNRQRVGGQK